MIKVKLTDEREVRVYIQHEKAGLVRDSRATVVKVVDGSRETYAASVCSVVDNFCKRVGRRIAATRLLATLLADTKSASASYCKEDRCRIFNAVCPEYHAKVKVRLPKEASKCCSVPSSSSSSSS